MMFCSFSNVGGSAFFPVWSCHRCYCFLEEEWSGNCRIQGTFTRGKTFCWLEDKSAYSLKTFNFCTGDAVHLSYAFRVQYATWQWGKSPLQVCLWVHILSGENFCKYVPWLSGSKIENNQRLMQIHSVIHLVVEKIHR